MAPKYDSTGSVVVRWQPQQRGLVPSSVGTSHTDLVKHTGKMASGSQQYDGFTEDDLREYEQEQREFDLGLDLAALIRRKPRNHKQKLMMEHIAKEKEQKKLIKNKWMFLSPIDEPTEYAIEAKFDTGAVLNFMTERMIHLMGLEKERLDHPQNITTATGPAGVCEYHVVVNWRGRAGCHGEVEFIVLPETSTIPMPLIGTKAQKCWDNLLDEQPQDALYYTALSKQKAMERMQGAALRTTVLNQQSQLQRKKEVHEERWGGGGSSSSSSSSSSSKLKGSRANEKKAKGP